ncbi:MAG: ATP-binding protein [Egibacteraceae bacterium]
MARHLRERIFERGTASAQAGGRGLGLGIARQLVDDQGGVPWYEDRPDGGACCALRLPTDRELPPRGR